MLVIVAALAGFATAQTTGKTVRHHKVEVEDPSSPPELIQAETAIEKQDYATAEPLLKKVVASDPDNFAAWFDLGFLYNAQGKTEDSIAAYRKSVAAKPGVFESNLNLGLMLVKAGQPDAEQFLRAATKLKPTAHVAEGQARAWLSLGHVLETTNPDAAIEAYTQAAHLDPKDPEPHLSAGPLLEAQNRYADAEQEYKQAFALDPSSTDALTGMANIYMRGHRFTEAEDILRKLVALHPTDAGAHMQLGRMLAADGQPDPAIAELQEALKLAPNDATRAARPWRTCTSTRKSTTWRKSNSGPCWRPRRMIPTCTTAWAGFSSSSASSPRRSRSCSQPSSSNPTSVLRTVIWPEQPMKPRTTNW